MGGPDLFRQMFMFVILGFSRVTTFKKGVPSAVGFPHCAGSGEGLSLSPKPYPHKCAEAEATFRPNATLEISKLDRQQHSS